MVWEKIPDPQQDVHHGDTAETEFHPSLYVGNIFPTYMQYGVGKGKKCSCVNETEKKIVCAHSHILILDRGHIHGEKIVILSSKR